MKPFDNIAISSGEPRNNADVWIKHGKNLFNAIIEQGGISDLGADNAGNNRLRTLEFIFLKKGTYTLSFTGLEYSGGYLYNTNGTFNKLLWAWTTGNKTFILENDSLLRLTFKKSNDSQITPDVVKNIQIEAGSKATEYEAPVVDDILVNHNGVYNSILNYAENWKDLFNGFKYRKVNKSVEVLFNSKEQYALNSNEWKTLATLPVGYRPKANLYVSILILENNIFIPAMLAIDATGAVSIKQANGKKVNTNEIRGFSSYSIL